MEQISSSRNRGKKGCAGLAKEITERQIEFVRMNL